LGWRSSQVSPNQVRPKLVVADAATALDFYANVFGANEIVRYDVEGAIVFAETEVFGTRITLKDADQHDPVPEGAGPILDVLVADPDRVAGAILGGGGSVVFEVSEQPFGGRWGRVRDPFGVQWLLHNEPTMSPDEIRDVLHGDPPS
jgi:PhnB protein